MAQTLSDNILADLPKILDDKMGVAGSNPSWRPYNNVAEFTTRFPVAGRAEGQFFWVRNPTDADKADLYACRKTNKAPYKVLTDIDLSNYYNITETNNLLNEKVNIGIPLEFVGEFLNDTFERSSLGGNYTQSLATASLTFPSSQYMEVTGGNNTANNYIQYTQGFNVGRSTTLLRFIPKTNNSGSYGIGLASSSIITGNSASFFAKIDLTVAGLASFGVYTTSALSVQFASASGLAFLVTDELEFSVKSENNYFVYTLENKTTGILIETEYLYSTASVVAPFIPNFGRTRIYFYGGTQDILNLYIEDQTIKDGNVIVVGDSIAKGYNADTQEHNYANLLFQGNTLFFDISAGAGERSAETLNRLPQLLLANPSKVIEVIGVNDALSGISVGTFQANVDTFVNTLITAGIDVDLVSLTPQNSVDVTPYNTALQTVATNRGALYIDTFTLLTGGSGTVMLSIYNSGDGTHPNKNGHGIIAEKIKLEDPDVLNSPFNDVKINRIKRALSADFGLGVDEDGSVRVVPYPTPIFQDLGTNVTPVNSSKNLLVGDPLNGTATATPSKITIGGGFADTSNAPTKMKLILLDFAGKYGFGVSNGAGVEVFSNNGANRFTVHAPSYIEGLINVTGNALINGTVDIGGLTTIGNQLTIGAGATALFKSIATNPAGQGIGLISGSSGSILEYSDGGFFGIGYITKANLGNGTSTSIMRVHQTSRNVNFGGTSDFSSASFQVESVTKGMLTPRMTTTQFNNIASKVSGLMAFDLTAARPTYYAGTTIQLGAYLSDLDTRQSFTENTSATSAPSLATLNAIPLATLPVGGTIFYTNDLVLMSYTRMSASWLQTPLQKVV